MFEKIQSTVKSEAFQRKALEVVGGMAQVIVTITISTLVSRAINAGVDAVIEQLHPTEVPAE